MPVGRLVLHVRHRDGDAPFALFRRVVDRIEGPELYLRIILAEHLGDRRGQRGLAVIDVPDRPDIHVRLAAFELFLRHASEPFSSDWSLEQLERGTGFEPATIGLEGRDSSTELPPPAFGQLWSLGPGLNR